MCGNWAASLFSSVGSAARGNVNNSEWHSFFSAVKRDRGVDTLEFLIRWEHRRSSLSVDTGT